MGYFGALITRFMDQATILEPLVVLGIAYLSYLTAEIFHMSGILSITFCGITMKNYVERNISSKSQTTLKYAMKGKLHVGHPRHHLLWHHHEELR